MATMKDVARLAGVSHGTVSNVLNGSKSVSSEKIKRVQQAMEELGYKPNFNARSLKSHRTDRIAVILPDVTTRAYAKIYEEIDRRAAEKGLTASLHVSADIPARECRLLEQAKMTGQDGVILLTCQPHNTEFFARMAESGLAIAFIHRRVNGYRTTSVEMEVRSALAGDIRERLAEGCRSLAIIAGPQEFSFDRECVDAYKDAMRREGRAVEANYIETVNSNRESAMRAAIRLLEMENPPKVIYTADSALREGAECVLSAAARSAQDRPRLIAMDAEDWATTEGERENILLLPYTRMARAALDILCDIIANGPNGGKNVAVPCTHRYGFAAAHCQSASMHRKIRVLTQDSPSSHSIKSLMSHFRRATGIDFELNQVPYSQVLREIHRGVPSGDYDLFTFGIEWFKELALMGYLHDLTDHYPDDMALRHMFSGDVLNEHCYFENRLYALPFSFAVQILFYRKDLFEELRNQRMFFERTKCELRVPGTWREYNQIARFFTRKYNRESETRYGTTLGAMNSSGAVCEFLPRLWAAGGSLFEDGKVALDRPPCVAALKEYLEGFKYACSEAPLYWWDEQFEQFARGDAAMMCLYSDHATGLEDRSVSNIAGKVGFSLLPGSASVLGGWSIAVNPYSDKIHDAFEFAKWTAAESLTMINAMLGRIVPYRSVFDSSEMSRLYPWYQLLPKAFAHTRRRSLPKNGRSEPTSEAVLERILGDAVHAALERRLTPEEALSRAAEELRAEIE
ncbi:MAG: extracellular solute-binding protein [Clostridiales bacterium]|nr:extracellular solute-binding protein [Clostridiales bacterium]